MVVYTENKIKIPFSNVSCRDVETEIRKIYFRFSYIVMQNIQIVVVNEDGFFRFFVNQNGKLRLKVLSHSFSHYYLKRKSHGRHKKRNSKKRRLFNEIKIRNEMRARGKC